MTSKITCDPNLFNQIQAQLLPLLHKRKKIALRETGKQRLYGNTPKNADKLSRTVCQENTNEIIKRFSKMNTKNSKYYLVKVNESIYSNFKSPVRRPKCLSPLEGRTSKKLRAHRSPVTQRTYGIILNVKSRITSPKKIPEIVSSERTIISEKVGKISNECTSSKPIQDNFAKKILRNMNYSRRKKEFAIKPLLTTQDENRQKLLQKAFKARQKLNSLRKPRVKLSAMKTITEESVNCDASSKMIL
ncbi:unnamed protein product [Moneuplotes crassus]|uniref:Uncharacterized protein n=1 Tax=Euplotes crassus TaxID=5936 RepID=A0AAD2CYJ4_EUPCR|nr:unnamed protein product [Moneuplotes crassus]